MWHINPLLGNDRGIKNYTTAVTRQQTINNNREMVFSVQSVLRYYEHDSLGISEITAGVLLLVAVSVISWKLMPGTVREPRGNGTSDVGRRYQVSASVDC
jgi:hypothetical protein